LDALLEKSPEKEKKTVKESASD
jgi:hypothetical protein